MPLLRIPGALGRYAGGMTDIVVGAASVAETLAEATAAALEVDHTLTPLVVAGGAVHGIAPVASEDIPSAPQRSRSR